MNQDVRYQIVGLLPRLRSFGRALAGNRADADDLVQQTCERALVNLDKFTPGTRLESWLFRIMRNLFIDQKRAARPTTPMDDGFLAETLVGEDGRRTTEARLELDAVAAAMAELPEEQRSVLVLVCVEGLRYREAAEVLDVPTGTVMSRLARARAAIAAALDGQQGTAKGAGSR